MRPVKFMYPKAKPKDLSEVGGPNKKMNKATTNGALKCKSPYGIQAIISKNTLLKVANTLDKLSPYNIVSMAGRDLTLIGGFHELGIFPVLKNKANQANMGKAWTKNCDVNGIKKKMQKSDNTGIFNKIGAGNMTKTKNMTLDKYP